MSVILFQAVKRESSVTAILFWALDLFVAMGALYDDAVLRHSSAARGFQPLPHKLVPPTPPLLGCRDRADYGDHWDPRPAQEMGQREY